MDRRSVLRYAAWFSGAAVSAPLAGVLMSGCSTSVQEAAIGEGLSFFNQGDFDLVTSLVDGILPRTDSPSATDVGVHHMIDHMAGKVFDSEHQKTFADGIAALRAFLQEEGYEDKGPEEQLSILTTLESGNVPSKKVEDAYRDLKQQVIAYYLTTEEVGMNFLNYLPVPGEYQGCISVEEAGGKAWAL